MWSLAAALLLFLQNPDPASEGLKALNAQKYDLAVQYFTKAVEADSKDYAARFNLALANSMLGKDADAIAGYKKVLELKPGLYQAELNLGMVLLRDKQPHDAISCLQAAADQKPNELRPRLYLAEALFDSGDFAKAEHSYRAASAIDAKSALAELGLARSEAAQNRLKDAEPHFRRAAELDPSLKDAVLELGPLYEKNNQTAEAIAIYQQFPENVAARERLGELLVEAGRPADAIPHLEWAVQKSPTAANRFALAQAYRNNHQPAKGLPLMGQAVEAEPGNLGLRLSYGRALWAEHKYAEAAQQFYRVTQARPDSLEAWNGFAAALEKLDDYPRAIAALDRIRALGGERPAQMYLRASILDRAKDLKGALASYQKFLAADGGKLENEEFIAHQRIRTIERELSNKR